MVKVPRNRIRRVLRRHQPDYRLSPQMDILVGPERTPARLPFLRAHFPHRRAIAHAASPCAAMPAPFPPPAQVYLNYILFLKRLAAESEAIAAEQGSPSVQPEHVKAVMSQVLRRMKA